MDCPIKLVIRKCDKCPFGKEGCDFPHARGSYRRRPSSFNAAKVAFRQRFEEIKDDIASGRITFYNTPEWTEKLLNITALNCTLLKIHEEAKWN